MTENPTWHSTLKSRIAEVVDGAGIPPEQRTELHRRLERCVDSVECKRGKNRDGSIESLSERVLQAEERLAQARKMEAIGRLNEVIVHDFNNHLTGILGYSSLLKTILPENGKEYQAAAHVERSATRASVLTRQLLAYIRRETPRPRPIHLRSLLEETAGILSRKVERNVEIRIESEEIPGPVSGDAEGLVHAFVSLGINAAEAMPGGGILTFSTSLFLSDGEVHAHNTMVPEGKYLSVCVSDTGVGIPESLRDQVFIPFFTTKPPDKGAGIGLPLVRSCVRMHGGFLRLASQEGMGTTVQILLPLDTSMS